MNAYETVTNRIIESLDKGIIPWKKEWTAGSGFPSNYLTKKPYRGINIVSLLCSEYASAQWMTFNQAKELCANVRKGEHGSPIVFWKFDRKQDKETGEDKAFAFARQYTVFNVEQIDGLPAELPLDKPEFNPIAEAEAITSAYLASEKAPTLAHGGGRAFYSPSRDNVQMPQRDQFTTEKGYYSTLFHEFAHSTGHKTRLDRFDSTESHNFGSESYSKEELIAEFTSAFIMAELGIQSESTEANSAAYIQGWLRSLKNDKSLAVIAAQRAQRASDYILQRSIAAAE